MRAFAAMHVITNVKNRKSAFIVSYVKDITLFALQSYVEPEVKPNKWCYISIFNLLECSKLIGVFVTDLKKTCENRLIGS